MAGPAKQFDRNRALNSAMTVFWDKGYEATSMQQLVQAMGVNRASLYDTFGNKHMIYLEALDSYCASNTAAVENMLNNDNSALLSLEKFLYLMMQRENGAMPAGCFVNNAAVELGRHDEEVANKVNSFWRHIEGVFKAVLDRAVEQKEINPTANTREQASFINVIMQGLAVKSKAGLAQKEIKSTIELLMRTLQM